MNKENGHQAETSSKDVDARFSVTEEEIEQALGRLYAVVEGEQAPETWKSETDAQAWQPLEPVQLEETGVLSADVAQPKKRGGRSRNYSARRRRRWAWTAAAAVVVVGTLLSPFGTKAMAAAMQTLYFHNVVGVGQDDLSQIQQALQGATGTASSQSIDLKQYGSVDVSGDSNGNQSNLTVDAASKLVGYSIATLPGFDASHDTVYYSPSSQVTFRLKTGAINSLIERLGGKNPLPSSVNEEPVVVQIPARVSEDVSGKNSNVDMSLTQMKMPTVQVPGDVDLNQVKQALLDLPFLPSDIRQSLQTSTNWQDTLYVPVGGKVTNLTVNGYSAVLQTYGSGDSQDRSMLWVEHGVLYQLSGSPSAFLTDASIIAVAKELSQ